MPIWFQINRSRLRMPFWYITAVKIKCFFFSRAELPLYKLTFLATSLPAPRLSDPAQSLQLPFSRASGARSCDVTSLGKNWLSPARVYLWQLEGIRIAQLFTCCIKPRMSVWRLSRPKFDSDRKRLDARKQLQVITHFSEKHVVSLFVMPARSQLTLRSSSIASAAPGWKLSTRRRMWAGNARVSWGMLCARRLNRNGLQKR